MRLSPSIAILRTQSDERLVALARGGSDAAFAAIVERYRRTLQRASRRVLTESRAEDAVQQAFMSAWLALQRGDEVANLRAWLLMIARNTALNARRVPGYDHAELRESLATTPAPQELLERREVMRRTLSGLAALPDRQRDALLRSAVAGVAYADIARDLGLTEGATRQLVLRARTTMRAAATALVPWPLVQWLALSGVRPDATLRVAELTAAGGGGAGATALLAKSGIVAVVAGGVAIGPAIVPPQRGGTPPAKTATAKAASPVTAVSAGGRRAPASAAAIASRDAVGAAAPAADAGAELGGDGWGGEHAHAARLPSLGGAATVAREGERGSSAGAAEAAGDRPDLDGDRRGPWGEPGFERDRGGAGGDGERGGSDDGSGGVGDGRRDGGEDGRGGSGDGGGVGDGRGDGGDDGRGGSGDGGGVGDGRRDDGDGRHGGDEQGRRGGGDARRRSGVEARGGGDGRRGADGRRGGDERRGSREDRGGRRGSGGDRGRFGGGRPEGDRRASGGARPGADGDRRGWGDRPGGDGGRRGLPGDRGGDHGGGAAPGDRAPHEGDRRGDRDRDGDGGGARPGSGQAAVTPDGAAIPAGGELLSLTLGISPLDLVLAPRSALRSAARGQEDDRTGRERSRGAGRGPRAGAEADSGAGSTGRRARSTEPDRARRGG